MYISRLYKPKTQQALRNKIDKLEVTLCAIDDFFTPDDVCKRKGLREQITTLENQLADMQG